MTWYWTALIVGALTPFAHNPQPIVTAAFERGFLAGVRAWLAACAPIFPLVALIFWVASLLIDSP